MVELQSPQARLREVRDQASATTKHRGHTTDIYLLSALYDPSKWAPYFDPVNPIPATLLGDMLLKGATRETPCTGTSSAGSCSAARFCATTACGGRPLPEAPCSPP